MLIGNVSILERNEENVMLKVNRTSITIHKLNTLDILCDPFPDDTEPGAYIHKEMSFDDFVSNIDDDNEFIDDLIYIKGIAVF